MAMSPTSGGERHPTPTVNVTPLVDVALVVLIIFMVVTPLMTKTFWLNLPREPDAEATPARAEPHEAEPPIVMTLDAAGVVRVNAAPIERVELAARLPRMLAAARQKVVYFDAADGVRYGDAVELMDASRAAGARSIAMLTEPLAH
ncbi:MAG: biopolymer transporter ExbD [Myxococcales bacterium]|nr:biopolymer transporter ExbD [Myxococcales bacterium]